MSKGPATISEIAPGSASKGRQPVPEPSRIFDPVARALEVIGDRWTLVLVRQLIVGPKGFQELRVRTGIAPRVLSGRLRQLIEDGFIEQQPGPGARGLYAVTERGRTLEHIISSIALWWVRQPLEDLQIDPDRFNETSPQSILESLPFLLREEVAREDEVTFEIRLTGGGGGVWTVHIHDGSCEVRPGFAEGADVRYTADARVWCSAALGLSDPRDAMKRGEFSKEGGPQAIDHYFHQPLSPDATAASRKSDRKSQTGPVGRKE